MPVSPQKLEANRINARKSTGPRTQRGKSRSRLNGLTHGIFCRDVVLPGESKLMFHHFRHSILMELKPLDMVELMLVDRIVAASWRLRRAQLIESTAHQQRFIDSAVERAPTLEGATAIARAGTDPKDKVAEWDRHLAIVRTYGVAPDYLAASGFLSNNSVIERLSRYEQRLELTIYRCLRELERLRKRTHRAAGPEPLQCPFVPEHAYRRGIRWMRMNEANQRTEPTDASVSKETVGSTPV